MKAALYTRISKDDKDERLGVQRQEQDLRREAERRDAEVVMVEEDNDLSGSGKVHRPGFERVIAAIEGGTVDLVLAYDLDRLFRGMEPYVRFYKAVADAKIVVAWMGGQADFATETGILELDVRASFAREELRKVRSRTSRAHQQLAENGKDAGGGRPFGYQADRHTLREPVIYCRLADRKVITIDEPTLVGEAARRALEAEPLRGICSDWNRRGVLTTQGDARWSPRVLKRLLVSARISGRRELSTVNGVRTKGLGRLTAKADWPGIISPGDSDRLRAILTAPERRREAYPRRHLLAGFLVCGRCQKGLHTSSAHNGQWRAYSCISGPGRSGGCGGMRISAKPLEALVTEALFQRVDEGALARVLRGQEDDAAAVELASVEARIVERAREREKGEITDLEYRTSRSWLIERQKVLTRTVEAQRRRISLDGLDPRAPLRDAWPSMELHRQRAVLSALVEQIQVAAATHRGPVFDPDRVSITWRA